MSNEHVAAIKHALVHLMRRDKTPKTNVEYANDIISSLDALARQLAEAEEQARLATIDQANTQAELAEAEARVGRLRKYISSLEYDIMAIQATEESPEKWRQGWLDEWKRTRERHGWQIEDGDLIESEATDEAE